MSNIVFIDHNFLAYAFEAGGEDLLEEYLKYAKGAGYGVSITDIVRREIRIGRFSNELGSWLEKNGIAEKATAEAAKYEEYLENKATGRLTGNYESKNAGDRSIAEAAKTAKGQGHTVRIFSDDKWFRNPQLLKPYDLTPAETMVTADTLNHAAASGSMTPENFSKYRDAYLTKVNPFMKSGGAYSPGLDRFLTPDQLNGVLKDGGSYKSAILPKSGTGLKALGVVGLALDIGTSSADAASAAQAGKTEDAANIMARLAGRLWGALAGAEAGGIVAASGGPVAAAVGAVTGGILGAYAGETAVDAIWDAGNKAIMGTTGLSISLSTTNSRAGWASSCRF